MHEQRQSSLGDLREMVSGNMEAGTKARVVKIVAILLALIVQNTVLALLLSYSFREGAEHYSPSTVVLFSELLKFSVCSLMILRQSTSDLITLTEEIPKSPLLFIPALLYVIQNHLLFYGAKRLNPLEFLVCIQMKILTTAIASRILLSHKVTSRQYMALGLLVCGIVAVQHFSQTNSTSPIDVRISERISGIVAVLLASCTSGLAGVVLEKVYKSVSADTKTQKVAHNVWTRNVQLSLISTPFAILGLLSDNVGPRHLLDGYDAVVIAVLLLQAVGGLIIAFVMKLANNILKCMAICISICLCAVYSSAIEGAEITLPARLGISLVFFSIALYFTNPKANISTTSMGNK